MGVLFIVMFVTHYTPQEEVFRSVSFRASFYAWLLQVSAVLDFGYEVSMPIVPMICRLLKVLPRQKKIVTAEIIMSFFRSAIM